MEPSAVEIHKALSATLVAYPRSCSRSNPKECRAYRCSDGTWLPALQPPLFASASPLFILFDLEPKHRSEKADRPVVKSGLNAGWMRWRIFRFVRPCFNKPP